MIKLLKSKQKFINNKPTVFATEVSEGKGSQMWETDKPGLWCSL